jgi:HTH-type transcriptional regulator, sugar sensing transcriptional regulator
VSPEKALRELGFTDLEARIYCELVRSAPATGYRLAQSVGKAAANVYQALSSLEQEGAIVVDDGATKSYRPVAPEELLGALEERFAKQRQAASVALQRLHAPMPSDKIFQLRSATQVLNRARQMLVEAREIVLFDLFPGPLSTLRSDLAAAASRGVQVAGIVYSDDAPSEFLCVTSQGQPRTPENWPGSQLTLVTDARQFLVALLSEDGSRLHHGFWSDSVYLSCLQHSGLGCEVRLHALGVSNKDPLAKLSLLPSMPHGLRELAVSARKPSGREKAA